MIQHAIAALFTVCLILLLSGSIAVGNGGMDDWEEESSAGQAEPLSHSTLPLDRPPKESDMTQLAPWPTLLLIGLFGIAFWTYPYLRTGPSTTDATKENDDN